MARTLLTPERHADLVRLLANGATIDDACASVGIHRSTFYAWVDRGEIEAARVDTGGEPQVSEAPFLAFYDAQVKARADARVRAVSLIMRAAQEGHWQAAAWYLERSRPLEWARTTRTEISGPQGAPVAVQGVPIAELEESVQTILRQMKEQGGQQ